MSFDPRQPYNDLPLLSPPVDLETKPVLKKCIAANKALAELKGAGDLIPNQAALINAIPLQEAKLSSEIESIVTTQDALFQAALDESRVTDPAVKEVLRYRTALRRGFEAVQAEPFRLSLLEEKSLPHDMSMPSPTINNVSNSVTYFNMFQGHVDAFDTSNGKKPGHHFIKITEMVTEKVVTV